MRERRANDRQVKEQLVRGWRVGEHRVTEWQVTERRVTERRVTEQQVTERRVRERQVTERRVAGVGLPDTPRPSSCSQGPRGNPQLLTLFQQTDSLSLS